MTDSQPKPAPRARLRALLFLLLTLLIGAVLIVAMTWFVVGSAPRSQAVAVAEGVAVSEFAALPGEDAYPAALALDAEGRLYTGSYQTGAVWAIDPAGQVREIIGAEAGIGSVTGLDVGADGALYILDRVAPLDAQGAVVWSYDETGLRLLAEIPAGRVNGLMLPDDIAVDRDNHIYISDRDPPRLLRLDSAGETLDIVWRPRDSSIAPTGLAYDSDNHALLITDSANDHIYRLPLDAPDLDAAVDRAETLFSAADNLDYGLDGIDIAPDGAIYVALLNWNRIARLDDGALVMLARDFRGSSDVAVDAARGRLYVSNWNQFSLGFGTRPQLPFALDVVQLDG